MTITTANYHDCTKNIDWNAVPASLKKTHETLIPDAAKGDWQTYHTDGDVRRVVEKYFSYITKYATAPSVPPTAPVAKSKQTKPRKAAAPKAKLKDDLPQPAQVVFIPTSTAFIKRYVALHGKVKKRDQILSLIHGLQKAITEQRIKTGHPALREIEKM